MADSKGNAGDGPAIGIDLGTTYSCVAVWRNGSCEVLPNDQGNSLTPSCVAFKGAERHVGEAAVNQAALNPDNTIFGENHAQPVSSLACVYITRCFLQPPLALRSRGLGVSLICVTDRIAFFLDYRLISYAYLNCRGFHSRNY